MNRRQTETTVVKCSLLNDVKCTNADYLKHQSSSGWLPRLSFLELPKGTTQFVTFRHDEEGGKLGCIALYDSTSGARSTVAKGSYDILKLIGTDSTFRYYLFLRTEPISSELGKVTFNRLVYMYDAINETNVCVSCSTTEKADMCTFSTAEIGPNKEYCAIKCLGPSFPYIQVRKFSDFDFRLHIRVLVSLHLFCNTFLLSKYLTFNNLICIKLPIYTNILA